MERELGHLINHASANIVQIKGTLVKDIMKRLLQEQRSVIYYNFTNVFGTDARLTFL